MRIALVIDDSLDRPDGVQQYMTTLGDYYQSQGHEAHYITTKTKQAVYPNIHNLGYSIKTKFNGNVLTMPLPLKKRKAKRLLKNEAFDVVHVQLPYSPFFSGTLISLLPKHTALFGTFHILPYNAMSKLGTRLLGAISVFSLRRFDNLYSVSQPAQEFAKKHYGIDTQILPNAIATESFKNSAKQPELRVVFLGRLVKRKGCEHFLRIMAKVSAVEPSFLIEIAGDGPERAKLEHLAETLGLSDRIAFHGFVDEQQKRQLLANATVAVFPSLGGESFGIVLVEAMSAGAVVIAGDNPGYRSVMHGNNDQLIQPNNVAESAEKILVYLTDAQKRKHAIEWQNNLLQSYDVKVVGDKLLKEYAAILKSKHRLYNRNNA